MRTINTFRKRWLLLLLSLVGVTGCEKYYNGDMYGCPEAPFDHDSTVKQKLESLQPESQSLVLTDKLQEKQNKKN